MSAPKNISPIEQNLLQQIALGNKSAFSQYFQLKWAEIFRVALALTHHPELAEEIVQDIFLKIWENRDRLPNLERPDHFIFILTRNHIFNTLQKKAHRSNNFLSLDDWGGKDPSDASFADQQLLQKEWTQGWKDQLSKLPPQQRQAFILNKIEGFSLDEVAQQMGISKLTVKVHLRRAIHFLRTEWGEKGYSLVFLWLMDRILK